MLHIKEKEDDIIIVYSLCCHQRSINYTNTMTSPTQFIEDAVEAAKRAVQFDSDGQPEPAVYFYKVAAKLLLRATELSEPEKAEALQKKALEYNARASALDDQQKSKEEIVAEDETRQRLKRCHFLLQQALDADSAGVKETAVELYTNAIEYVTQYPDLMHGDLRELILQALERAENLKGELFGVFLYRI